MKEYLNLISPSEKKRTRLTFFMLSMLLIVTCIVCPGALYAQQTKIKVTGIVTDTRGDVLTGVSIVEKGTTNGVVTDVDGNYSILVPSNGTLCFSYIGFKPVEKGITGQRIMRVQLEEGSEELEEVVVVAYGIQKKATMTGAVAAIATKDIKQSPSANLAVTLTGRLPGLFAQQVTGLPGNDQTNLFLRGRGTVNGSSPLILVDGVERELITIDPNEVETVSILKDASSTALFGVRGANGVILVTTKRGTEATPTIGFTAEVGMQGFTRSPSSVDSYTWAQLKNEAWHNDNPNPTSVQTPPYSKYALERYRLRDDPEAYPDNDWSSMLMKDWTMQQRYNLNINGKTDKVRYFINVGYLSQDGQFKIDPGLKEYDPSLSMERYNFRSNIDLKLNKYGTSTFLNAAGYLEKLNGPYVGGNYDSATASNQILDRLLNYWPSTVAGPLTPEGEVLVGTGNYGESPWAFLNRSGYRKETRASITASWGMEQDFSFITKGLSAKLMVSFDSKSYHYLNGVKTYQYWNQVVVPDAEGGKDQISYVRVRPDIDNTPINTNISAQFQSFYEVQLQANYNRVFGKHTVAGLILFQQQALIKPKEALPFNVRGLAARMTYSFDDRYIAEVNAGYNGSEQFAKGHRYGFFPSFSVGWNIHNEHFFKPLTPVVNRFKIRGSYGTVGNDMLGSRRFLYLDEIKRAGDGFSGSLGHGSQIAENFFGRPDVQWEIAKKGNLGIEMDFLNDFALVVDLFKDRRDNVLIYRESLPSIIGVPSNQIAPANIGIVTNKGYEFELNYKKVINKDLSFLLKGNFNYTDNKILFCDEISLGDEYAYPYRKTGFQIDQQFGYQVLGYYASQEEIDEVGIPVEGKMLRPGDFKYLDVNGDKIISDKDRIPIGESSVPKYNWGAGASITYKDFDLSFLFQGAFKVTGMTGIWEMNNFRDIHKYAWTQERATSGDEIRFPALSLSTSASETQNSFFIQDKSFVRLKNLELGYNLPKSVLEKVKIRKIRLYVNGLNLFTLDKLKTDDWDPELAALGSYPVYRVFNVGANVTF